VRHTTTVPATARSRTRARSSTRAAGLLVGVAAAISLAAPGAAGAAVTAPPQHHLVPVPRLRLGERLRHQPARDSRDPASVRRDRRHRARRGPQAGRHDAGPRPRRGHHPGGACWVGVTPDIRPDDTVRIINQVTGEVDTSKVRDVTASRPVQTAADTVQIHGTARDALGNPLPIAELEQRLVAPNDAFLKNGRRTLRATSAGGADGTLPTTPPAPSTGRRRTRICCPPT
jgi:hypothetical protein